MLDNLKSYQVVLASKSPRRQELLRGMGLDFTVLTKETPETFPSDMSPEKVPTFLSRQKSLAFAAEELPASFLLITADTIVLAGNEILGKPVDRDDALRMLGMLSGKRHHVVTGVTVRNALRSKTFSAKSAVRFAELDADEMCYYVDRYRPYDKAGSYGIQEWIGYVGISGLNGSFYNVTGLPTRRLYQVLKQF